MVARYPLTGIFAAAVCLYAGWHLTALDLKRRTDLKFWRYSIYLSAKNIASFAATHPGTYAMGDRAGTVAYYLPDPTVQTEGLMMDKAFLENIKQQRNLKEVLNDYNVRYFIATNPTVKGPCLLAREPAQGGPDTPAMQGLFCSPPVHEFESADHYKAFIFDMTRE